MKSVESALKLPSPAAAIAWEIFRPRRVAFLIIGTAILLSAGYRLAANPEPDVISGWCVPLMALSLAAIFVLFRFTESDRRQRSVGFPSRLFTLPATTFWLVTWPMLYGVAAVLLVYLGWAALVLRPTTSFPLGWPCLYLATGMICFQAIVWALADFRIIRLMALGLLGTLLAFGWIIFSPAGTAFAAALGEITKINIAVMPLGFLGFVTFVFYCLALYSVGRQRRGIKWELSLPVVRGLASLTSSFVSGGSFRSLAAAQFWFEWRRNGILLPTATATVSVLVLGIGALSAGNGSDPAHDEVFGIVLSWLLALPLLLAFILGQGWGKTSFLSGEMGLPLYLAARPITAGDWLGAKLRTAALSAVITWLLSGGAILFWLMMRVDFGTPAQAALILVESAPLFVSMAMFSAIATPGVLGLLLLMLFTWRLLTANLYLGILGSRTLMNAAACFVFIAPFVIAALFHWMNRQTANDFAPAWLPALLAVVFLIKAGLAVVLFQKARRKGLVSTDAALKYFLIWLTGTLALLAFIACLPVNAATSRLLAILALFVFPIVRIGLAPLAFAVNRHR